MCVSIYYCGEDVHGKNHFLVLGWMCILIMFYFWEGTFGGSSSKYLLLGIGLLSVC